jgi:hypothetical protein
MGEGFVLPQQTQQQVLGLNVRASELAGFKASKKDDAPRFISISLEHGSSVVLSLALKTLDAEKV